MRQYFHCLQVFEIDEMTLIADLCKKHDVMVISDDVYEWLIYPDNKMIKIGMLRVLLSFKNMHIQLSRGFIAAAHLQRHFRECGIER